MDLKSTQNFQGGRDRQVKYPGGPQKIPGAIEWKGVRGLGCALFVWAITQKF